MKRLLRIFDLSKNEQRVVLIVMFALITVAFIGPRFSGHQRRNRNLPRVLWKLGRLLQYYEWFYLIAFLTLTLLFFYSLAR
jgi:hypothetical protein